MAVSPGPVSGLAWLRLLACILIESALLSNGDINYIPALSLMGALMVATDLCAYVRSHERAPHVLWTTLMYTLPVIGIGVGVCDLSRAWYGCLAGYFSESTPSVN